MFIILSAVILSVLIVVPSGGCMCPRSISVFHIGTDSCVFMYNSPHSASAADAITYFIILDTMNIGPLKMLPYFLPKQI